MRADKILLFGIRGPLARTVAPEHAAEFEALFGGLPLACIGRTVAEPR
jgi:hypothetical protein